MGQPTTPGVRPQRFVATKTVQLNASGYGYATITCPAGVRWEIGHQSASTNISNAALQTTPAQPTVAVYQDSAPNLSAYLEGSYSGDRTSSDSKIELLGGESVTCEWTTPAAGIATHASLYATYIVRGLQWQERM